MIVIYLFFSIIAVYLYIKRKYSEYLIVLAGILSFGYGFLPSPAPFKVSDVVLINIVLCILQDTSSLQDTSKVGRIIKHLIVYFFIVMVGSILLGVDSVLYCIMTFRLELYFLSYFVFKRIPYDDVHNAINKILLFTIIGGVFFYLQFLGINGILHGASDEDVSINSRVTNAPLFTIPMLLYVLVDDQKGLLKRTILVFFLCGMLILGQSRGLMISLIVSICVFYFIRGQFRKFIKIGIIYLLFIGTVWSVISYRFSSEGSTSGIVNDVTSAYQIVKNNESVLYDNSVIYSEGTFTYRMLFVNERMERILSSPITAVFGLGTIHGNSPKAQNLGFRFGNIGMVNDRMIVKQIDTTDVSFITHILRYGLVYLFLILSLIKSMYKKFKSDDNLLYNMSLLFLLCKITQCLGSDTFNGLDSMFILLLVSAISVESLKVKL